MALQSAILSGNARLEQAASAGPAVKPFAPDDPDAVRRIQRALVALGFPLPRSSPNGPGGEPDGIYGNETAGAVMAFQRQTFLKSPSEWDGRAGPKTLPKMDALLPKSGPSPVPPAPATAFVCGPDVTDQIAMVWSRIQGDFRGLSWGKKMSACSTILIPVHVPDPGSSKWEFPSDLEKLKQDLQNFADINGWDTLPLYQGASDWLRTPPVYDPAANGPCAMSPGTPTNPANPFDRGVCARRSFVTLGSI